MKLGFLIKIGYYIVPSRSTALIIFGQIVGYRKLIYSPINWDFTLISQLLLLLSLRNLLTGSYSAQWSVNKKELHNITYSQAHLHFTKKIGWFSFGWAIILMFKEFKVRYVPQVCNKVHYMTYMQSHYIEVSLGAIFMEKNMKFGPESMQLLRVYFFMFS